MVHITENKLIAKSERVKAVDFHATEALYATAFHNGTLELWDSGRQTLINRIQVSDKPLRSVKFIPQTEWVVTGGDDLHIHVYNYTTTTQVTSFAAHKDFIRSMAPHATKPYLLSCGDDKLIQMWDWSNNWALAKTFDGHQHYVMQVVFNPLNADEFATASLDQTARVWSLGSVAPKFVLKGHLKGVNTVEFVKDWLVTGSDDTTVRVWSLADGACIQTIGNLHENNVTTIAYHRNLDVLFTGGEDGRVLVMNGDTLAVEHKLELGLQRVWNAALLKSGEKAVFACDTGSVSLGFKKSDGKNGSIAML
ncbi:Coatomer subunit beta' [Chytriomyces hyalinus]|nr:Coatomer subunit beta' [Chytriomyces hyalinus]